MDPDAAQTRQGLIADRTIIVCNADGEAEQVERGELRTNNYVRRTTPEERETPTQRARRERREREAA